MLFQRRQQLISQRFERHASYTSCKRTVLGSLKLSRFAPAGLLHLGRHVGRVK